MSTPYIASDQFTELTGLGDLARYRFGDVMVNHYFCKTCGIYPFHDVIDKPGLYRVNPGCLDDIDPLTVAITLIDGRSF
ncbi:MAG: hypothetical protein JWO36_4698 [Myxococcales bacterium]|nr:hypothetical protein [Myxococcales bacterium]